MRYNFFISLGKGLKKIVVRCCIFIAVIIALSQSFSEWGPLKWAIGHVDLDKITAPASNSAGYYNGKPAVSLNLKNHSSLPEAYILVNGKSVDNFSEQTVTIPVMARDTIKIDVTEYDFEVEIQVLATSDAISSPEEGKNIVAEGNIVEIGKVKLRYNE